MKIRTNEYIVNIDWERGKDELFLGRMSNTDDIFLTSLDVEYSETDVYYTYSFYDFLEDNIKLVFSTKKHNYFNHDKLQSLEHCIPYLQEVISKDYPEYFI
jgi:hypothetical protein